MTCCSLRSKRPRTNKNFPHFGRTKIGVRAKIIGGGWGERKAHLVYFRVFWKWCRCELSEKNIISRPVIYWQGENWSLLVFFRIVESAGKSSLFSPTPPSLPFVCPRINFCAPKMREHFLRRLRLLRQHFQFVFRDLEIGKKKSPGNGLSLSHFFRIGGRVLLLAYCCLDEKKPKQHKLTLLNGNCS